MASGGSVGRGKESAKGRGLRKRDWDEEMRALNVYIPMRSTYAAPSPFNIDFAAAEMTEEEAPISHLVPN